MKPIINVIFLLSLIFATIAAESKLYPGQCLHFNDRLKSINGCFELIMQEDGNLVLYKKTEPIWSSKTYLTCSYKACYQSDGNLVVSNCKKKATWVAGTFAGGLYTELQDDGNLVLYADNPLRPTWASNTVSSC